MATKMVIKKTVSKHSGSASKVFLPKELLGQTVFVLTESEFEELSEKKIGRETVWGASLGNASIYEEIRNSLNRIEQCLNQNKKAQVFDYDGLGEGLVYEDANESRIMEDLMKSNSEEQFALKVKMYRDNAEISEERIRKLSEVAWGLLTR